MSVLWSKMSSIQMLHLITVFHIKIVTVFSFYFAWLSFCKTVPLEGFTPIHSPPTKTSADVNLRISSSQP